MNLVNMARSLLNQVPGANTAIDAICARANEVFGQQHNNDTGAHTAITATSFSVPPNAADNSGTVGSSLAPTPTGTYDLGVIGTAPTLPFFAWRNLYLSGGIEWVGSDVSASGQHVSAYSDRLSGSNRVTNGNISGQTHTFINNVGTTLRIDNASVTVGPAAGRGTSISTLQITGNVAADNGLFERSRTVRLGEWTDVTFNAANFTGSGAQTWTLTSGDQVTLAYTLVGKKMTVVFTLNSTTVGGTPDIALKIAIPGGFTAAKTTYGHVTISEDGTSTTAAGICRVLSSGTTIDIHRQSFANFTGTTNLTYTWGAITFEVA